jgi:hypothetical protein
MSPIGGTAAKPRSAGLAPENLTTFSFSGVRSMNASNSVAMMSRSKLKGNATQSVALIALEDPMTIRTRVVGYAPPAAG